MGTAQHVISVNWELEETAQHVISVNWELEETAACNICGNFKS